MFPLQLLGQKTTVLCYRYFEYPLGAIFGPNCKPSSSKTRLLLCYLLFFDLISTNADAAIPRRFRHETSIKCIFLNYFYPGIAIINLNRYHYKCSPKNKESPCAFTIRVNFSQSKIFYLFQILF